MEIIFPNISLKREVNFHLILVNEWTNQEVCDWLNQIGFGDCIEEFKENHIEGDSLLTLNNNDLKELNVAALGDRKILQR